MLGSVVNRMIESCQYSSRGLALYLCGVACGFTLSANKAQAFAGSRSDCFDLSSNKTEQNTSCVTSFDSLVLDRVRSGGTFLEGDGLADPAVAPGSSEENSDLNIEVGVKTPHVTANVQPHQEVLDEEIAIQEGEDFLEQVKVRKTVQYFEAATKPFVKVSDKLPLVATRVDEKLSKQNQVIKAQRSAGVVRVVSSPVVYDVPFEALEKARRNFRSVIGLENITVPVDERYVGSLMLADELLSPLNEESYRIETGVNQSLSATLEHQKLSDAESASAYYSADKTYAVVNGRIVEVEPAQEVQTFSQEAVRTPKGVIVALEDAGSSGASNGLAGYLAGSSSGTPSIPVDAAEKQSKETFSLVAQNAAQRPVAALKPDGLLFDLSPEQKELSRGLNSSVAAELGASADAAEIILRGKVAVPVGVQPQSVVLRISGTDLVFTPDASGHFEIPGMPVGAKFEIIAWDTNNTLARKSVPVSVSLASSELLVKMDFVSTVESTAEAFGFKQDQMLGGFCASLEGVGSQRLEGGRVTIASTHSPLGQASGQPENQAAEVGFFGTNALPAISESYLTSVGRFCVFNVRHTIVDLKVELPNGMRRSFAVVVRPTFFDNSLVLNMGDANYRPVNNFELVDSQKAYEAAKEGDNLRFGESYAGDWLNGKLGAVWSPVYGIKLRADAAYAEVPYATDVREVVSGRNKELVYLPVSQEWQELAVRPDEGEDSGSFALVSRGDIVTPRFQNKKERQTGREDAVISVDRENPLSLFVISEETKESFFAANPEMSLRTDEGGLFVSVDLSRLGMDYSDFRMAVKEPISGKNVGIVKYLPHREGLARPRQIRAFVSGLSEGQFTLQITNQLGAIKWFDIARGRPGKLQVLSIKE